MIFQARSFIHEIFDRWPGNRGRDIAIYNLQPSPRSKYVIVKCRHEVNDTNPDGLVYQRKIKLNKGRNMLVLFLRVLQRNKPLLVAFLNVFEFLECRLFLRACVRVGG
jgi:hypothetical protein